MFVLLLLSNLCTKGGGNNFVRALHFLCWSYIYPVIGNCYQHYDEDIPTGASSLGS